MISRRLGVEEELLLVDPQTMLLTGVSDRALRAFHGTPRGRDQPTGDGAVLDVEQELFLEQLETSTQPTWTLAELRAELVRCRRQAIDAAAKAGARCAALATPILDAPSDVTKKPRYQRIVDEFGLIGRQGGVCAMHIHVEVSDDDEGVLVLDRLRPWLPALVAMSANSPYWNGVDTGFASWRTRTWGRWPTAGQSEPYGSADAYRKATTALIEVGAALDPGMLYLDARLSRFGTVEVRVTDVCTDIDDAVLIAGLTRALVSTLIDTRPDENTTQEPWRTDLLRAAHFVAARDGLSRSLVDPIERRSRPAHDVVRGLRGYVSDALDGSGESGEIDAMLEAFFARGVGASRQRAVAESAGALRPVVEDVCRRTEADL